VFSILLAILLSTQTINMLGRAAQGRIASDAIFALIGFWSIGFFPVLMILTIFVSVIVTLTRMWREHEMAVWMASGKSLTDWVGPVLRFALPLSLLIAVGTTYFIESYSVLSGATRNVFVQSIKAGEVSSIFAKAGQLSTDKDGNRVLILEHGSRYTGEPGSGAFEVAEFEHYTLKISDTEKIVRPELDSETRPTLQLLGSSNPADRAELAWRLSLPLCALILAVLAIPLSYFNPRAGHAYNLVFALGAYLVYQNLMWLLRDAIGSGKLSSALAILLPADTLHHRHAVHAGLFAGPVRLF